MRHRGPSLGSRLLGALPLILIFILVTLFLERGGWLRSFETAALDAFLLLKDPLTAENVVIVTINDDDYRELFNETSPLDPHRLGELIEALRRGNPRLIAVDIDTSARVFRNFHPPSDPKMVWARGARPVRRDQRAEKSFSTVSRELFRRLNPYYKDETIFEVGDVYGGKGDDLPSGIALMPRDVDSAIRRFRREYRTSDPARPVMPSFSQAVVRADGRGSTGTEEPEEGWVMNFSVDEDSFHRYPASVVLSAARGEGWGAGPDSLLAGKIVLLGGTYAAARDEHLTPSGPRHGIDLHAYAVESELQGKTLSPPRKYVLWVAELLVGFTLVIVYNRLKHRRKAMRASIVIIPLLALLASFLVFSSLSMWVVFMPVLLVVFVQQGYEDLQEYRKRVMGELYDETSGLWADLKDVWGEARQGTLPEAAAQGQSPQESGAEGFVDGAVGGAPPPPPQGNGDGGAVEPAR